MKELSTSLRDVRLFELRRFGDERGLFFETFAQGRYDELSVMQSNVSVSAKGVLRGLHSQMPTPQGKLLTVLAGAIFDVLVDARTGSPDFGKWEGFELSAANGHQLWAPPGFLHGFLALEEGSILSYHVDAPYDPKGDLSVRWDDPDLAIAWPLKFAPILSPKDAAAPPLRDLPPERLLPYSP